MVPELGSPGSRRQPLYVRFDLSWSAGCHADLSGRTSKKNFPLSLPDAVFYDMVEDNR